VTGDLKCRRRLFFPPEVAAAIGAEPLVLLQYKRFPFCHPAGRRLELLLVVEAIEAAEEAAAAAGGVDAAAGAAAAAGGGGRRRELTDGCSKAKGVILGGNGMLLSYLMSAWCKPVKAAV